MNNQFKLLTAADCLQWWNAGSEYLIVPNELTIRLLSEEIVAFLPFLNTDADTFYFVGKIKCK